jgi:hypothetical protein
LLVGLRLVLTVAMAATWIVEPAEMEEEEEAVED